MRNPFNYSNELRCCQVLLEVARSVKWHVSEKLITFKYKFKKSFVIGKYNTCFALQMEKFKTNSTSIHSEKFERDLKLPSRKRMARNEEDKTSIHPGKV